MEQKFHAHGNKLIHRLAQTNADLDFTTEAQKVA